MGNAPDLIAIGKITGAHGIKGAVKIVSFAESDDIFTPGTLLRTEPHSGERQSLTIQSAAPQGGKVRLVFKEVSDRTAAESLSGTELFIERSLLPEPEEGDYYWSDIIGLSVYTVQDDLLGRIASIMRTGSNDVYVVEHRAQGKKKEMLIPALASIVKEIDLKAGKMVVDLPEGLE